MYQLIKANTSPDAATVVEQIYGLSKAGDLRGILGAVLVKRGRFFVFCAGDALRNPTFARGMTLSIDDELRAILASDDSPDTTF